MRCRRGARSRGSEYAAPRQRHRGASTRPGPDPESGLGSLGPAGLAAFADPGRATLALRLLALAVTLSFATLTLALALFTRAIALSLLALTLPSRGAAFALLALLSLTALALLRLRLFLTLRRFLALGLLARLPLTCGLARGSSTLLGSPRLGGSRLLTLHSLALAWHSLACCQHGAGQERSSRCD